MVLTILGLVGLYFGGEWLVTSASKLARSLGIPALIVGLTIVSIGTSTPELLVSTSAALRGSADIAIGNVLGILGATAAIQPIQVMPQITRFDGLVMIGFSLLALPFVTDRRLGRIEAALFLTGYLGYIAYSVFISLSP